LKYKVGAKISNCMKYYIRYPLLTGGGGGTENMVIKSWRFGLGEPWLTGTFPIYGTTSKPPYYASLCCPMKTNDANVGY
jgi:hypothetical protein